MMCLCSDSLMWGERSLGWGLCVDLCHPENARGTFGGGGGGQGHEKTIYQLSWRRPQYSLFQNEVLSGIRNLSKQLLAWLFFPQRYKDWIKLSQNLFSPFRRDLGRCVAYQHNGLLNTAKHGINCGFIKSDFLILHGLLYERKVFM